MKKLTKLLIISMVFVMTLVAFAACGGQTIMVVARESGSGTRAEFDRAIGLQELYSGAQEITSNGAVITTVAQNPLAIGYISAGTVNATVKAITVNGYAHTHANFPIARPFIGARHNDATLEALTQDFWNFLQSARAAAIINVNQVAVATPVAWTPSAERLAGGTIYLRGSSSVEPLMLRLVQYYVANVTWATNDDFDVDMPSTSRGFNNTEGIQNSAQWNRTIAFSSAYLTAAQAGFSTQLHLAQDMIAVIVHPDNNISNLTLEEVRNIFSGETTTW